jgi:N-methylhydantoinase A/oxoprolinase/acetone carboxylase beta subunit
VRETTTGAVSDYAVHDRAGLAAGARVAGPAIIAEDETSTLVAPGWTARIDAFGYIAIARERA